MEQGPFHYVPDGTADNTPGAALQIHPCLHAICAVGPLDFDQLAQSWHQEDINSLTFALWSGITRWQQLSGNPELVDALNNSQIQQVVESTGQRVKYGVTWQVGDNDVLRAPVMTCAAGG